ncbi:hypothetical protein PCC7811_03906 [Planktothrix agardhii]|nr:hypothetical protein [Planktothrix agardhii]CAD5972929.1 hypothetical protein PCC7811_03906 [Planktothrix agardhii]
MTIINNDNLSELSLRIDSLLEPLFTQNHRQKCYIGLLLQQGKRKMIQINVPAFDLPTLLQAKPSLDNNPDSGKYSRFSEISEQRKTLLRIF